MSGISAIAARNDWRDPWENDRVDEDGLNLRLRGRLIRLPEIPHHSPDGPSRVWTSNDSALLRNEYLAVSYLTKKSGLPKQETDEVWMRHIGAVGQRLGWWKTPDRGTILIRTPAYRRKNTQWFKRRPIYVLMSDLRQVLDRSEIAAMSWKYWFKYGRS